MTGTAYCASRRVFPAVARPYSRTRGWGCEATSKRAGLCRLRRQRGAVRTPDGELIAPLTSQNFIALALLGATSLVAGFFAYIYNLKRQTYLLFWTSGWAFLALSFLGGALATESTTGTLQSALDQWLYA